MLFGNISSGKFGTYWVNDGKVRVLSDMQLLQILKRGAVTSVLRLFAVQMPFRLQCLCGYTVSKGRQCLSDGSGPASPASQHLNKSAGPCADLQVDNC